MGIRISAEAGQIVSQMAWAALALYVLVSCASMTLTDPFQIGEPREPISITGYFARIAFVYLPIALLCVKFLRLCSGRVSEDVPHDPRCGDLRGPPCRKCAGDLARS